jgi:hypothetical protein
VITEGPAGHRVLPDGNGKLFQTIGEVLICARKLHIDLLRKIRKRTHGAKVRLHQPLFARAAQNKESQGNDDHDGGAGS